MKNIKVRSRIITLLKRYQPEKYDIEMREQLKQEIGL